MVTSSTKFEGFSAAVHSPDRCLPQGDEALTEVF